MPPVLVDTDTLSAIMRNEPAAVARARAYLKTHPRFQLSCITRYEILRGLKAKAADKQALLFNDFCGRNAILQLDEDIIDRATDIYADLYRRGLLIGDADILIAATALEHGLGIATNNESHFRRIKGLRVENWLR